MSRMSVLGGLGVLAAATLLPAGGALAQSAAPTGSEIAGHSVTVDTNGVVNTVYFDRGGTARIVGAAGNEATGNWFVENRALCLTSGASRECWPYQVAFQGGRPVNLTSDCGVSSLWTPVSTEPVAPPPVQTQRAGERG